MRNHIKLLFLLIILLSVGTRVAAALYLGGEVTDMPGTADQISYHHLALRVLEGHGLTFGEPWWPATAPGEPTAHWSYLYTGFLVLVYAVFGPSPLAARLIQAVLVGMLHPLLAYVLGRKVFGQTVGLLGALFSAIYAYFVYYAANLMTESFYILAILASFWLAIRLTNPVRGDRAPGFQPWQALAFGLVLGAAVLLRQLFLLLIPFLFLWVLLSGRKQIGNLVVSGLVLVALILPFTYFNYTRFDRFVLLNTNAGFAFYWGNHPIYGTQFESILPYHMGSYRDLLPQELLSLDEASLDQALLGRGIQFILDDLERYILLSLSRVPAYFKFWPSAESSLISNLARTFSFGIFWPFMLYGLLVPLLNRRSKPPASLERYRPPSALLLVYGFIFLYTLIHLLTWALIRYRLPVDAFLVLFAGLALVDLRQRIPALRRRVRTIA